MVGFVSVRHLGWSVRLLPLLLVLLTTSLSVEEEFRDADNETSVVLVKSEFDDIVDTQDNNNNKRRVIITETTEDLSKDIDPNVEKFIPRREWQEIKQGQAIPSGLHVRINFQTRIREAKILEPTESDSKPNTIEHVDDNQKGDSHPETGIHDHKEDNVKVIRYEPQEEEEDTSDRKFISKSQLKHALKDFRDKFHNDGEPLAEISSDDAIKKKFRSIEEIRADLEHLMGHPVQSDVDVMKSDIAVLSHKLSHDKDKENALDNLENYVHQLDNGRDLEKIGGLSVVVDLLNSSIHTLREKAARVLGSACQSNPFVQSKATEHGALSHLLRILLNANSNTRLTKSTLFALSALVRGHSVAQVEFTKLNGIAHLLDILKDNRKPTVVRIKAMNLISDLVTEQREAAGTQESNTSPPGVKTSPLETALANHGWCTILPHFLMGDDKDIQEKTLQAMSVSTNACRLQFKSTDMTENLRLLRSYFKEEQQKETDRDYAKYLEELGEKTQDIIDSITN